MYRKSLSHHPSIPFRKRRSRISCPLLCLHHNVEEEEGGGGGSCKVACLSLFLSSSRGKSRYYFLREYKTGRGVSETTRTWFLSARIAGQGKEIWILQQDHDSIFSSGVKHADLQLSCLIFSEDPPYTCLGRFLLGELLLGLIPVFQLQHRCILACYMFSLLPSPSHL